MDAQQLRADMEADRTARQAEILFYQNQVELARSDPDKDRMRRALVLLLYAHYEGFTKFAFAAYISAVNAEGLKCAEANSAIVAAALSELFKELRNPQPISGLLRGPVPEDSALMRFAREREFVERAYEFLDLSVVLTDSFVETEWNLKPPVLRKLLYRLGLDTESVSAEHGRIEELVNRRNNIAHGSDVSGISEATYIALRDSSFRVMSAIARVIGEAAEGRKHLKAAPASFGASEQSYQASVHPAR